ncbi:hypothetical protein ACN6K9_003405 [Streptomyces sp. SAS_267]|uniref:hypothetical protein n=1 Tax=unclassified Streptomyces TaxID=2593676 RepID=UPI0036FD1A57
MTCPDNPFPSLSMGKEALFAAAAAQYDRYRPGVPAEMAELPADTVRGLSDPTLLDLNTSTGQVPRALLDDFTDGGSLLEEALFTVLARRPAGAR